LFYIFVLKNVRFIISPVRDVSYIWNNGQ